ncbi:CidA/LrgA family protein [Aneurinibacillus sp. BA2021]|nr:CidA/LrgA family protein [Aneurinibacillus sp. BA2021]
MKAFLLVLAQLAGLWGINKLGYLLADTLQLPVPGNAIGMVLLFILLATGVVRLAWIEQAATFLIRHLAFFFIPVAVGLMNFGGLFTASGPSILIAIIASTAIGMLCTGWVSQTLERRKEKQDEYVRDAL